MNNAQISAAAVTHFHYEQISDEKVLWYILKDCVDKRQRVGDYPEEVAYWQAQIERCTQRLRELNPKNYKNLPNEGIIEKYSRLQLPAHALWQKAARYVNTEAVLGRKFKGL